MLKKNMGNIDRILRFVVGAALLVAWYLNPDMAGRNWLLVGIIPLVTSLFASCPLYSILGLSTCPTRKS